MLSRRALLTQRSVPPALGRLVSRGYHEIIVEHYENPRNVGILDKNDTSVGTVRCYVCSGFPPTVPRIVLLGPHHE
jgi:hypothetical protein